MKLIVGFPRCGNQSHFETFGTASSHDLIYEPDGVEQFQENFPGYTPMILTRKDRWEHAFSLWTRACKMLGETRKFENCYDEYYEKSNFDKYIEPWLKAYPDIEILLLEDLIKDPKFLHIDNFSIPHNTKKNTFILKT
jgi:hypothetical protein